MRKDTTLWNIFFIVLYALELAVLVYFLNLREIDIRSSIQLFDITILVFAILCVSRLITKGKITDFIREYFGKQGKGFRGTIYELLICPWCVSMWAALLLVHFHFFIPGAWIVILILALSGVVNVLQGFISK